MVNRKRCSSVIIIMVLLLSASILQNCLAYPFEMLSSRSIREGQTAPDFTLSSLSGEEVTLSDLQGKSIILFFWATWCPHCRTQLYTLSRMHPEIQKENIEILSINIREYKGKVESFMKKYKAEHTTLLDSFGKVADLYNVSGIPVFYFISKKGKILRVDHELPSYYKTIFKGN